MEQRCARLQTVSEGDYKAWLKTQKKTGLGRGFAALMPDNFDTAQLLDAGEKIHNLDILQVVPNPTQPRQQFDDTLLEQLAASIQQHGVLQPIVVTPSEDGRHIIVAGERRWRASQLAGLKKIPALVRTLEELAQLEIALIENVQRVDLSPIEQARSIERLHQQFNVTYDAIALRLGRAPSTVNNIVRLLHLPSDALQVLEEGQISEGHARAILALKEVPEQQQLLLTNIVKYGWSVREAERFVTSVKAGIKDEKTVRSHVDTETPDTKRLSSKLGVPVRIKRTAKGGRLELTFKSDEELQQLLSAL